MTTILVIEDEDNLREEIVTNLQFDGYQVAQASDGQAGVTLAQEQLPDLVLCDIMMPVLDGYGVLLELRTHPETAAIPFLFLTAKVDKSDIRYGMELGADDYLLKPFRYVQLRQAINTRLEKRAAVVQGYEQSIEQLQHDLASEHERLLAKSQFLSMIVHDLKTPLASILSSAELLKNYEDKMTPDRKRAKIDRIEQAVHDMLGQIDDLLVLGQTEIDSFQVTPTPVNFLDLCAEALANARIVIQMTHQINMTVQENMPGDTMADPKILKRVFSNLIMNAVKYSPPGSTITITLSGDEDKVRFTIQDQGIGIPVSEQANLFKLFQRASNVGGAPGNGLGLAIVKRGVDVHSGNIYVTSIAGQGATFVVTLPRYASSSAET